ncbi:hypothetical protein Rt10032_c08g3554 [Rhodotorula toruloides]|uniref:Uncharacterized protein n=1 Tax=Rhodotorula toruloides TaxID=5286 RepID=A0A511KGN7_RHOTO|nr:hypothetical protein Rt10032_c08g3554 [Rhodotorula toruloides]
MGEIAFVVFTDAVVIASIAHNSTLEEAFPLRKNTDRYLGLSMPSYLPSPAASIETLSLLTSSPSIFSVSVSPSQGHRLVAPGTEGYKSRRLQTRIEQAVFFGTNLAWINDAAIDRFDHASLAFSIEALKEPPVATKKLMLSLSKLAQVAQLDHQALEGEEVQRALETVDDNLDLVNTQQNLSTLFTSLLYGTEMRIPPTEQGAVLAACVAPALTDRSALAQYLASLCARVFADESISPEDLINILTLKEDNNKHASDFATALDILL